MDVGAGERAVLSHLLKCPLPLVGGRFFEVAGWAQELALPGEHWRKGVCFGFPLSFVFQQAPLRRRLK